MNTKKTDTIYGHLALLVVLYWIATFCFGGNVRYWLQVISQVTVLISLLINLSFADWEEAENEKKEENKIEDSQNDDCRHQV